MWEKSYSSIKFDSPTSGQVPVLNEIPTVDEHKGNSSVECNGGSATQIDCWPDYYAPSVPRVN